MKLAFVADLHFEGKKLEDKKQAWKSAVDDMIKQGIERCILLGDIFGNKNIGGREASTGTVFNAFKKPFDQLQKHMDTILAEGNHDQSFGQQKSALETLKNMRGFVIQKNFILSLDGICLAIAPWSIKQTRQRDLDIFLNEVRTQFKKHKGPKIFVGHLTVRGAVLNSGVPIFGTNYEITPEQIDNLGADVVAFGHIHKRQPCYVGALCQNNFGEEGNPTGYMIYDTETKQTEYREIESPKYRTIDYEQGISFDMNFKGYTKLRIKGKASEEWLNEILKKEPNFTIEIQPDKIIRPKRAATEEIKTGKTETELLKSYLKTQTLEENISRIVKLSEKLTEAIQ